MSAFYDQASLVMVPSGYKNGKIYSQKPLSASGELSFTRASNATRVVLDASGQQRLEKVRENLLFPSNDWTILNISASATNNTTANPLDGATTAATLTGTGYLGKSVSASGINTMSVYLKAGTLNAVRLNIYNGSTDIGVTFSLVDGSTSSEYGTIVNKGAVNVGNGWWRLYLSVTCTSALYAQVHLDSAGTVFAYALQGEAGDIATDYIATTSAAVSVGPVSGLPRLDYSGGCPSLLLEPQRTNYAPYSEQIDNASWNKLNTSVSANQATAPDGTTSADLLYPTTTGTDRLIEKVTGATSGQTWTSSFFVKASGFDWVLVYSPNLGTCWFNASTGAFGNVSAGVTAKVLGQYNGFYRISFTGTLSSGNAYFYAGLADANGSTTSTANGTNGLLFWGCQLEQGAYATSYIGPTLSSAVTRVADACSKTGISSLIGQTEGTLFLDFVFNGNPTSVDYSLMIIGALGSNYVVIGGYNAYLYARVFNSTLQGTITTLPMTKGTRYKVALAYANNDVIIYINGASHGVLSSVSIPAVSQIGYTRPAYEHSANISQSLLFKTRLSNADLATLTTL